MHIAAAAARACRNPSKHTVISTISRCDVKKTYENTPRSHKKILKICPRAHAESFQNQLFFNNPIKGGFEGNFCAHLELLQQRLRACEGHHPLQKMTRGAHARGRRARTSKSFQTQCDFNTISLLLLLLLLLLRSLLLVMRSPCDVGNRWRDSSGVVFEPKLNGYPSHDTGSRAYPEGSASPLPGIDVMGVHCQGLHQAPQFSNPKSQTYSCQRRQLRTSCLNPSVVPFDWSRAYASRILNP